MKGIVKILTYTFTMATFYVSYRKSITGNNTDIKHLIEDVQSAGHISIICVRNKVI